jgi:hypothetical protein
MGHGTATNGHQPEENERVGACILHFSLPSRPCSLTTGRAIAVCAFARTCTEPQAPPSRPTFSGGTNRVIILVTSARS